MPEDFLKNLKRTTSNPLLKSLVEHEGSAILDILYLYDEWKASKGWYDDEDLLEDPPGCFQC